MVYFNKQKGLIKNVRPSSGVNSSNDRHKLADIPSYFINLHYINSTSRIYTEIPNHSSFDEKWDHPIHGKNLFPNSGYQFINTIETNAKYRRNSANISLADYDLEWSLIIDLPFALCDE